MGEASTDAAAAAAAAPFTKSRRLTGGGAAARHGAHPFAVGSTTTVAWYSTSGARRLLLRDRVEDRLALLQAVEDASNTLVGSWSGRSPYSGPSWAASVAACSGV